MSAAEAHLLDLLGVGVLRLADSNVVHANGAAARLLELEPERLIGRSLFRPTSFAEIDSGADGILVTVNRGMSAAGRTFITYDPTGRIYEALVTVADRRFLTEPRIAAHELLHAIGLGHTRSWTSVMAPNTGANNVPSVDDVAYAQLYYAISELQRQREAPFGILEAVNR